MEQQQPTPPVVGFRTVYKATFSIKIKHWNNMTALSNMPIVAREK